jgi:hypothetical protein
MIEQLEASPDVTYLRYGIESMDGALLRRIMDLIGVQCSDEELDTAVLDVSRSMNRRPRDESISWQSLPEGDAKKAVGELASRYGYSLP